MGLDNESSVRFFGRLFAEVNFKRQKFGRPCINNTADFGSVQ